MGQYDTAICQWAKRHLKSNSSLFIFSTMITHILASILMMGAVPLSLNLLDNTIKSRIEQSNRFLSVTVSRGYILSHLWAPGAITLFLVVQSTKVTWTSILIPGFILTLLGFGLSYWQESRPEGVLNNKTINDKSSQTLETGIESRLKDGAAIRHVLIAAGAMVTIILILDHLNIGVGYSRIMLAGLFVAIIWTVLLFNKDSFIFAVEKYWTEGLLKNGDIGPFFIAMGFFSGAMEISGLFEYIAPTIQAVSTWLGVAAIVILPFIIIILSIFGLHPYLTIVFFWSNTFKGWNINTSIDNCYKSCCRECRFFHDFPLWRDGNDHS